MIALRLDLLTGRYVASEFNNRNRAEWPPHPARVFSSLVAAYHEGGKPAGGDAALRWLETLEPPHLTFSEASTRDLKTNYVPVNDKAASDSSSVDKAWAAVYEARDAQQRKKAETRLQQAYGRASSPDKSLAKNFREVAAHVLPTTRTKQPRTFPTSIPEDPVVHLTWEAEPSAEIRTGLDAVAAALVRIGHSSSMVTARWVDEPPLPTWVPDPMGREVLRWVGPGQLDRLEALHEGSPYAEQRVMPYTVARYHPAERLVAVHTSCFSPNFIVLRRVEGPRLPILASESIADGIRRALMSHADHPTPSLISGHTEDGGVLEADHLAVVPLAYVDAPHATGDVLGVALIPPVGLSLDAMQPLYAAVASWEAGSSGADGPLAVLNLGSLGRWELARSLDLPAQYNLRESTWTHVAKCWVSVTPVVLDRHPGSLDRPAAMARASETIAAACRRIGLPDPVEIELSFAPFVNGSEDARRFRRRAGGTDRRPLVHAQLRFDELVRGPVLLGAGRYRGLGLFRPCGGAND